MKTKLLFGIIFLIICTIMATACAERTKIVDSDFERNKQLWQESKIVDYNFVAMQLDMGNRGWVPFLIQVRNSKAISMKPTIEQGPLDRTDGYEDFETVEKFFNKIQEAYDKGYLVEVRYNEKYGYPEYTNINSMSNEHSAFIIELSKFEIIKTN